MNTPYKERLLKINSSLIEEGTPYCALLADERWQEVDKVQYVAWGGKIKSFIHMLGRAAKPWENVFSDISVLPMNNIKAADVLGTLKAIQHEIENDHLETFTQLVQAQTFYDLLEQAEHLLSQDHFLAAGVVGRAVLEEHLRNTCDALDCLPEKDRPTINDFNQSLYKAEHYLKTKMKEIDTLATIGNNAAHNKPELTEADVKKLIRDLPGVIESTKA